MKNRNVLQAKWKQVRGKFKEQLGKFTHNDAMRMQGQREQVVGVVQEKYGSTVYQAQKGINQFLKKINMH